MSKQTSKSKGPKKEFAPQVGFWPAKSGNGFTSYIDEKTLGELQKAQLGGRLLLSSVDSDNEKAPHYRVTIFPPSEEQRSSDDV
jgi:hypothetical protein